MSAKDAAARRLAEAVADEDYRECPVCGQMRWYPCEKDCALAAYRAAEDAPAPLSPEEKALVSAVDGDDGVAFYDPSDADAAVAYAGRVLVAKWRKEGRA